MTIGLLVVVVLYAVIVWVWLGLLSREKPAPPRADPRRIEQLERELRVGSYADLPPRPRRPAQLSPRSPLVTDDDEVYEVRAWDGHVIRVVGRRKGGK